MGNMCQEQKHNHVPVSRIKSQKTIMSTIDEYQDPAQDMRQFLSLTSQNTPSCDFEEIRKKRNERCINNFKVIRVLGQGSFGKVMLVQDSVDNLFYAMKIIEKKNVKTKEEKKHTLAERFILEAMDHPFVVKLHYAFQNSKKLYLFVDFMGGGELFYLLRRSVKFHEDIAKFYAAELLLALQYLHYRNIIYRDMKPQNILLDQEGHIKVADFGLSKICRNQSQTVYSVCGTPQYIAPQVIMRQGYNRNADWFSFGSVIYDMLTGKPPFYSKNKSQTLRNLCTKQIPIPQHLSDDAKSLLKGLFTITASKRLGANGADEIKNHPFFAKIKFDQLLKKKIKAPFVFNQQININGFDSRLKEKVALDSLQQENKLGGGQFYDNFSYQRPNSSSDVIERTLENSKAFTLEYVDLNLQ